MKCLEFLREKLVKLGDSILDFFATLPNPNNVDWIKSFNADLEADGERNKEFLAKHLSRNKCPSIRIYGSGWGMKL